MRVGEPEHIGSVVRTVSVTLATMTLSPNPLSKSRYLAGLQCTKRLYWEVHRRDLLPPGQIASGVQALLDVGTEVGRLARTRHPRGVLIEHDHLHHDDAVEATRNAMADPTARAIFEAAFTHGGVKIRADILIRRQDDLWDLQEVKASLSAKAVHLADLAIQVHVLRGSGVKLRRIGILHLNREYVRGPAGLDLRGVYQFTPLGLAISVELVEAKLMLPEFHRMLKASDPPAVVAGDHCHTPYECPFFYLCGPPQAPLDPGGGGVASGMSDAGIEPAQSVPVDVRMSALQRRMAAAVADGREYVGPGLRASLVPVGSPISFLDFEAFQPAIPRYVGTGPYTPLPTQWSLHRRSHDGGLGHAEFLHDADTDPRPAFADSLLAALERDEGVIVVFSPFEGTVIKRLAAHFPVLQDRLMALLPRLVDLLQVLRKDYYHPDFGGSFSLKSVLPVLVPDLAYADLAVQDGLAAAAAYARMIDAPTTPVERATIRESLLRYCERDTLALVRVREALLAKCGGAGLWGPPFTPA